MGVYLYAVLVAPLLSFLADAVVHNSHAVITQSAYNGFGYAAARSNLTNARLMGNGIDDVGGGLRLQLALGNHRHGGRHFVKTALAGEPGNGNLVQPEVLIIHIG